jgi:signal transduction histidine kinase
MERLPISGLRLRITAAAAVILLLFIIITEVSIAKLTRVAMRRYADATSADATSADRQKALETPRTKDAELSKLRRPVLFYLIIGAVSALLLTSFAVGRLVVRPLHLVNDALRKVGEGKLDTTIPISGPKELAELGAAFNRMTRELKEQESELKNRLRLIEQSAVELKTAQDRLIQSAKLASVGTLAAGVAHEIGNPLAGLLGLVESIEAGVDKSDETKFLSLMKNEILRIDRIIRDLLSYARTSNVDNREPSSARLSDVFEHVRSLLVPQSQFDRIEWTVPDSRVLPTLAVSTDDLTQIFLNLFLNAAEAMNGSGRIIIDVEGLPDRQNSLRTQATRMVLIRVSDTGPGIPEENVDHIFDPFFTTQKASKSCGLGLSVCQALVDRAGGSIGLDRTYAKGASFKITLPSMG